MFLLLFFLIKAIFSTKPPASRYHLRIFGGDSGSYWRQPEVPDFKEEHP